MTTTPSTTSAAGDSFEGGGLEDEAFETMRTDAVLTGRAMSSGEFLAGLLAAAQLDIAGTPRKLPADLWPGVDAVVVQEIWDRACAVAWRAAQFAGSPRLFGPRLHVLQEQLTEAGFHAMGGSVARSRRLVAPESHPADGEVTRGHESAL
jgi:hypothetical protein